MSVMHVIRNMSGLQSEQKADLMRARCGRWGDLEARVSKDSHHSNKPPSADGPLKKPKSLRQASGRKPGGQKGHEGSTLERVGVPDVVVQHRVPQLCDQCGATLAVDTAVLSAERRQVIAMPRIRYEITEHRVLAVRCQCGQAPAGRLPDGARHPLH